jgi:hypothetical protein
MFMYSEDCKRPHAVCDTQGKVSLAVAVSSVTRSQCHTTNPAHKAFGKTNHNHESQAVSIYAGEHCAVYGTQADSLAVAVSSVTRSQRMSRPGFSTKMDLSSGPVGASCAKLTAVACCTGLYTRAPQPQDERGKIL